MLDYGLWFDLRDEYRDNLSPEHLEILEMEQRAGVTPARRAYLDQVAMARPYYDVHKRLLLNHPERITQYEDYRRMSATEKIFMDMQPNMGWLAKTVEDEKEARLHIRRNDAAIDAFLFSFNDSITHPLHKDNRGLVREMELRPKLRVDLESRDQVPDIFQ